MLFYKILFKIFQLITYLPITYDSRKRKFKPSQLLRIYSIIILLTIWLYLHFKTYTWIVCLSQSIINNTRQDIVYILGIWFFCLIPIYVLIHQALFKLTKLSSLANELLELYILFQWRDKSWSTTVLKQSVFEFLIIPLTSCCCFGYMSYVKEIIAKFDSTSAFNLVWMLFLLSLSSIYPFCVGIQYLAEFMKFQNSELQKVLEAIITAPKNNNAVINYATYDLDRILIAILKIRILAQKLTQQYSIIVLAILLNITNIIAWGYYFLISSLVFHHFIDLFFLAFLQVCMYVAYSYKCFYQFIIPSEDLKNESIKAGTIVSDIQISTFIKIMPSDLSNKVDI